MKKQEKSVGHFIPKMSFPSSAFPSFEMCWKMVKCADKNDMHLLV